MVYDVAVYGSTPGGFCAAIAAAREGASVVLLEPTQHIGGLSTGGLSHCDSNQMRRETLMGLFDEWHRRVALKDGGVINEGTILPVRVPGTGLGYAYHVPYRALLPSAKQCTNLLVPVALSSTHVALSSLRIEGAWMAIGQGVGVAAALAAKRNLAAQDLPYPLLRERLLAQGQVLLLPPPPPKL